MVIQKHFSMFIASITRQRCIRVHYSWITNERVRLRCYRPLFVREEVFNLSTASVLNYPSFHTGSHPLGFRAAHWLLIVSCCTEVVRLGHMHSTANYAFLWFCAVCCACVCVLLCNLPPPPTHTHNYMHWLNSILSIIEALQPVTDLFLCVQTMCVFVG